MDRLLNYIFLLCLIYVFALWAPVDVREAIIIGALASLVFCSLAFIMGWLTVDGAASAMVVGTATFGLGGWAMVIALLCFFISSALITRSESGSEGRESFFDEGARRNGIQVWSNGFWLVIWLFAGILTNLFVCWMAAAAVIATATADTWATELGSLRFKADTYLMGSFKQVSAGAQGGVSWPGAAASFAGSLCIAIITAFGFSLSFGAFFVIMVAGFSGCLIDSYIGAVYQGTSPNIHITALHWSKTIYIDNNVVNWAATGFGSLTLLILNLVFL